jgi:hypothetical protein
MIGGGLMDDFDGVIHNPRYAPWDYNGTIDHHVLAVAMDITPDEGEMFTQHYSAGDLENFVPSKDGTTPVPLDDNTATAEDLEGPYAVRVGRKEQLSNSSNWASFMLAALDAKLPRERVVAAGNSLMFLDNVRAHFNRVPQKKRSGIVSAAAGADGKAKRPNDILVITEIKALGEPGAAAPVAKVAKAATAAAKSAPAVEGTTAASGTGDLDDRIVAAIMPAVTAAGEGEDPGLLKAKLPPIVLKAFAGAEKAKAVKRVGEADFLENREEFGYDPESGKLYPLYPV